MLGFAQPSCVFGCILGPWKLQNNAKTASWVLFGPFSGPPGAFPAPIGPLFLPLGLVLGLTWGLLGAFRGLLGRFFGPVAGFGSVLAASVALLGASRGLFSSLGPVFGLLGAAFWHLGRVLGRCVATSAHSWPSWRRCVLLLGPVLGSVFGRVGPFCSHRRCHLGHMLAWHPI